MTRRAPLMLIHGFNGVPGTWTDSGFRQNLIAQGDLDPDLVRVFRYGVAPDGTYDNRGDLRKTASRLAGVDLTPEEAASSSLERLSADSVARGGPEKVTLIGHSLGGIIASYFLSCRKPDEFGTVYRGNVGRVIAIGTPHLGVDLLQLTRFAPVDSGPWRLVRILEGLGMAPAVPSATIKQWEEAMYRLQIEDRAALVPEICDDDDGRARTMFMDSPVLQQIAPGSPLLASLLAADAMPAGVACHSLYGDILVHLRIAWGPGNAALLDRVVSFGDLTVSMPSASHPMGSNGRAQGFVTEQEVVVTLRKTDQDAGERSVWQQTPETSHARLPANRVVQAAVLALIAESWRL